MQPLQFIFLATCAAAVNGDQTALRPNILFILVDDLGYAEVGFNRAVPDPEVKTPNVDSLVNETYCLIYLCLQQYRIEYGQGISGNITVRHLLGKPIRRLRTA